MNLLKTSRYAALGLCLTSLALLWLLLIGLMKYPHRQVIASLPPTTVPHIALKMHTHKVSAPQIVLKAVPDDSRLALHTFKKEYTCVFTGKVTCANGPCQKANVKVQVDTEENPNIVKNADIQPDGTYQVSVELKELPKEQMDWMIVADSPDSEIKEMHGQAILDEDSNVVIEEPVNLL